LPGGSDARHFLQAVRQTYGAIFLDAFGKPPAR